MQSLTDQFAEYAVEKDDLADYLGFADCAFAQIWEHHHFEGEWGVAPQQRWECGFGLLRRGRFLEIEARRAVEVVAPGVAWYQSR